MNNTLNKITLTTRFPISHMSTNDGHLFSICKTEEDVGILACNGLDMGYSITQEEGNIFVYDTFMKIQEKMSVLHHESETELFSSIEMFEKFIHKHLLCEEYVVLDLDVSVISDYILESNLPTLHSPMVSGIDLDNKKIELNDFFDFQHYEKKWISIREVYNAYVIVQNYIEKYKTNTDDLWIKKTSFYKARTCPDFLESNFIDSIDKYLNPAIEFISSDTQSSFYLVLNRLRDLEVNKEYPKLIETGSGINVYYFLARYLQDEGKKIDYDFVKAICLLNFHFLILKKSVEILVLKGNLNDIDSSYVESLLNLAGKLKIITFKNFYQNIVDCKTIISLMSTLKDKEFKFLQAVKISLKNQREGLINNKVFEQEKNKNGDRDD